ncbi:MAG: DUF1501 domain-containing protein [Planctomycetaceae bacterium]|nr:DUF1501 domain-containing protein [Planctomycetaceae bacterium]
MFDLYRSLTNCQGTSRRAFLRVGSLSLLGLSLPAWLAARAAQGGAKDVSCILLWTEGGMSNVDTLDMKPDAPAEYRGQFLPIASNVPGIDVCEHLPLMSRQMDKVCLVKSIAHTESGDHVAATHYMLTGYPQRPDTSGQPVGSTVYPAFGSLVARQKGWQNGLPPNISFGRESYGGGGYMGSAYNPLIIQGDPAAKDFRVEDVSLAPGISPERAARRRTMIERLDAWQRDVEKSRGALLDRQQFYAQAFDLLTSPAAKKAFALSEEADAVSDRYGRTREGQAALLSRRLIEAGVRFVTIVSGGWDTHADNFNSLKNRLLPTLDKAWSALLEDLGQRGLLDSTVVICAGEFGRTPRVNGAAGRDHYAPCNVVAISGAGVKTAQTVGATDRKAEQVAGRSHSTLDYGATVMKLLGIDGTQEYRTEDGRPVLVNNGGQPIAEVLA